MDSYQRYIDSIKGFERITKVKEAELSRIIRRSKNEKNVAKAIEEMVHGNLFLVVDRAIKLKTKYSFLPSNIMDLIAEGNIALISAAKSYRSDHKSKAGFCSYAIKAIENKISRAIRGDKLIHVPEGYAKIMGDFKKLKETYKGVINDEVLMRELDISQEMVQAIREDAGRSAVYLEDVFSDGDGDQYWSDILEDTRCISPSAKTSGDSLQEYINKYLKRLTEREQYVIQEKHTNEPALTLDEISAKMKISRERVRQIYLSGLRKLKRYMFVDWESKHGEPPKITPPYDPYNFLGVSQDRYEEKEKQCDKIFKNLLTGE